MHDDWNTRSILPLVEDISWLDVMNGLGERFQFVREAHTKELAVVLALDVIDHWLIACLMLAHESEQRGCGREEIAANLHVWGLKASGLPLLCETLEHSREQLAKVIDARLKVARVMRGFLHDLRFGYTVVAPEGLPRVSLACR